mmetsp:Transcript_7635/g.16230  ORF Transcript_7635/g.16230 Transcript_7635/m.16230 type:complete len:214 (-) Transcript_7635:1257-1898(-)
MDHLSSRGPAVPRIVPARHRQRRRLWRGRRHLPLPLPQQPVPVPPQPSFGPRRASTIAGRRRRGSSTAAGLIPSLFPSDILSRDVLDSSAPRRLGGGLLSGLFLRLLPAVDSAHRPTATAEPIPRQPSVPPHSGPLPHRRIRYSPGGGGRCNGGRGGRGGVVSLLLWPIQGRRLRLGLSALGTFFGLLFLDFVQGGRRRRHWHHRTGAVNTFF